MVSFVSLEQTSILCNIIYCLFEFCKRFFASILWLKSFFWKKKKISLNCLTIEMRDYLTLLWTRLWTIYFITLCEFSLLSMIHLHGENVHYSVFMLKKLVNWFQTLIVRCESPQFRRFNYKYFIEMTAIRMKCVEYTIIILCVLVCFCFHFQNVNQMKFCTRITISTDPSLFWF